MATSTEEVKRLQEKYNGQIIKFEREERKIEFFKCEEWVEFIAIYFTTHYENHLRFWQATAVDDRAEYREWQRRLDTKLGPMYDAFKSMIEQSYATYSVRKKESLLGKLGIRKFDILIDTKKHAGIYEYALNCVGDYCNPSSAFYSNTRYILNFDEENVYKFSMDYIKK